MLKHFSESLLSHKTVRAGEPLACYAGLLAYGTKIDAKRVAAMVPGFASQPGSAAMRSLPARGRLRRANKRVTEFLQCTFALTALWGPGDQRHRTHECRTFP